jgi:predicted AAA+ superfamily ATPase
MFERDSEDDHPLYLHAYYKEQVMMEIMDSILSCHCNIFNVKKLSKRCSMSSHQIARYMPLLLEVEAVDEFCWKDVPANKKRCNVYYRRKFTEKNISSLLGSMKENDRLRRKK